MLSLIKIEINKVSKSKLFLAWFITILIVLGVTGIIIMGLGTDNKLGEFVGQSSNNFRNRVRKQLENCSLFKFIDKNCSQ